MVEEEKKEIKENQEKEEEQEKEKREEELSNEEIKQLLKNAGTEERKYFLELSEWSRPGNSFDDWGKIEVVEGKIKMIEIEHKYSYPTTNETSYIILPMTRVVILKHRSYNNYNDDDDYQEVLYVFSATEGWRSLRL
jgi:hypothetical protein